MVDRLNETPTMNLINPSQVDGVGLGMIAYSTFKCQQSRLHGAQPQVLGASTVGILEVFHESIYDLEHLLCHLPPGLPPALIAQSPEPVGMPPQSFLP